MKTEKIFEYTVARFHCQDESIYKTPELVKSVDDLFNSPDLDPSLENQNGKGVSTFGLEQYWLLDLKGIGTFEKWFKQCVLEAAEYFGHPGATDIEYYRTFTNKMWPGSSGNVHAHNLGCHGVAVFYFEQPENGSDLVLVKDSYLGATNEDIPEENKRYMNVKQGDLVLHNTAAWHSVSLHKGKTPRIVFVLEYKYI